MGLYGFDKCKTTILLDSRKTSSSFLAYCRANHIKYIDFAETFENTKSPVTLIYDHHWNDHGRELIAKVVSDYISDLSMNQKKCEWVELIRIFWFFFQLSSLEEVARIAPSVSIQEIES